jgi:VanZ family protein
MLRPETRTILFRVALCCAVAAITVLAAMPSPPPIAGRFSDKTNHVLAFLVLAFLVDHCWPLVAFGRGKVIGLLFYGIGIELMQLVLPHRFFSVADMAADLLGVLLYALLVRPIARRVPYLGLDTAIQSPVTADTTAEVPAGDDR